MESQILEAGKAKDLITFSRFRHGSPKNTFFNLMNASNLILPLSSAPEEAIARRAPDEITRQVAQWMDLRARQVAEEWSKPSEGIAEEVHLRPREIAEKVTRILTGRSFNFQSKRHLKEIIPQVQNQLLVQIEGGRTLKFYLLFHGGYRAGPIPPLSSLIFEPDQTELMLLYQTATLHRKIREVYPPGIELTIVVNNGVAKWVNNIPIIDTENYTRKLRRMLDFFGAGATVKVLLQSELIGFNPVPSFSPDTPETSISPEEHRIVERFLGRTCSQTEAVLRAAVYKLAEQQWAEELGPIVSQNGGVMMRQVPHPDMLSFRPFPGGAIRVQNGTLGFLYENQRLIPKLITTKNSREHPVLWSLYETPWRRAQYKPGLSAHET